MELILQKLEYTRKFKLILKFLWNLILDFGNIKYNATVFINGVQLIVFLSNSGLV